MKPTRLFHCQARREGFFRPRADPPPSQRHGRRRSGRPAKPAARASAAPHQQFGSITGDPGPDSRLPAPCRKRPTRGRLQLGKQQLHLSSSADPSPIFARSRGVQLKGKRTPRAALHLGDHHRCLASGTERRAERLRDRGSHPRSARERPGRPLGHAGRRRAPPRTSRRHPACRPRCPIMGPLSDPTLPQSRSSPFGFTESRILYRPAPVTRRRNSARRKAPSTRAPRANARSRARPRASARLHSALRRRPLLPGRYWAL